MKLLFLNLSSAPHCPLSGHHVGILLAIETLDGKIYLNFD